MESSATLDHDCTRLALGNVAKPSRRAKSPATQEGAAQLSVASAVVSDQLAQLDLARQFERLLIRLEASYYDDFGSQLDSNSRAGVSRFMRYHANKTPLLGAESTGRVVATWRNGDECLTLQFLDRFRFNFSFVTAQKGRRWGTAHALTFFDDFPEARHLVAA
jgi:hypothetical protein